MVEGGGEGNHILTLVQKVATDELGWSASFHAFSGVVVVVVVVLRNFWPTLTNLLVSINRIFFLLFLLPQRASLAGLDQSVRPASHGPFRKSENSFSPNFHNEISRSFLRLNLIRELIRSPLFPLDLLVKYSFTEQCTVD